MSGAVAHRLSGFEERNEGIPSRPGIVVTGDPDEVFRGGIGRLACQPFESVRGGIVAGGGERTFRRQISRYEADGLEGLLDKRLSHASHRLAPVDEVLGVVALYRWDYQGWNVKHFHGWYQREHGGQRSDTWVKKVLQAHGALVRAKARGKQRKRRERAPLPGMLVHQDASTHLWVPDQYWDLVVTLDDATGEHLSMFFCEQEGSAFVAHQGGELSDILCEQYERVVGKDNCVSFERIQL